MQTTWHSGLYLPPGDEDGARAASIIHMMFDLERSGGNILPELEAYLLLLLTGLARLRSREKEMDVMAGMETPLVPPALEPALLYVSRHYAEEILVEQMARSCMMSESHFRRMFTAMVGVSPLEYINRYRIHRSLNLLHSTSESDSEYRRADGLSVHHDLQPGISSDASGRILPYGGKTPESA